MKSYIYGLMFSCCAVGVNAQTMKNYNVPLITAADEIVIDGVKDAPYGPFNDINNCINVTVSDCSPITKPDNCNNTAKWSAAWSNDAEMSSLFVYASVNDSKIASTTGDGVEIFLSMDNNRFNDCPNNFPQLYKAATYQILFRVNATSVESPQGQKFSVTDWKIVRRADNTGYEFEAELLFSELDANTAKNGPLLFPEVGRIIAFDIGVLEDDKGAGHESSIMWNQCCDNRNWTTAAAFGTITLDGVTTVNNLKSLVNSISLFPNPAANDLNIKVSAKSSDYVTISMMNSLAQKVYSQNHSVIAGDNQFYINTANLQNGVYTVVINKGDQSSTEMVFINK